MTMKQSLALLSTLALLPSESLAFRRDRALAEWKAPKDETAGAAGSLADDLTAEDGAFFDRLLELSLSMSMGHTYTSCNMCHDNNPCTPENVANELLYHPHCDPAKFVQCDDSGGCSEMDCPPGQVWDGGAATCALPAAPPGTARSGPSSGNAPNVDDAAATDAGDGVPAGAAQQEGSVGGDPSGARVGAVAAVTVAASCVSTALLALLI